MSDAATATAAPTAPAAGAATSTQATSSTAAVATPPPATGAQDASGDEYEEFIVKGQPKRIPKSQTRTFAQKGLAADEVFREAQELKRSVEAEWEEAAKDPRKLREMLAKRKIDVKGISSKFLIEDYEEAALTPEQKQAREWKSKAEAYEAEKAAAEKKRADEDLAARHERHVKEIRDRWTKAMAAKGILKPNATGGFDGTPEAVPYYSRLLQLEQANLEESIAAGVEPLSADELVAQADADILSEQRLTLGGLKGKALLTRLNTIEPGLAKAVAQAYLEERTAAVAPKTSAPPAPAVERPRATNGQFAPTAADRDAMMFNQWIGKK